MTNITWMIAVGSLSICAQWLMTKGYKYCPASIASATANLEVPLLYLSGWIIFQQKINTLGIIGVIIVMSSLELVSLKYKS